MTAPDLDATARERAEAMFRERGPVPAEVAAQVAALLTPVETTRRTA